MKKVLSVLLAAVLLFGLIPAGIMSVSAEAPIETANVTVTAPGEGEHPDFAPVSDDEEKYTATVSDWYLYDDGYPSLNGESVFQLGKRYALRVYFEAKPGYEFTNETDFRINGQITACFGSKEAREILFDAVGTEFDVTDSVELKNVLNRNMPVKAINIVSNMTIYDDCTIRFDAEHIANYHDTVLTIKKGVTVTLGKGGFLGSFWPSYEGDWETPPVPNGKVINNGGIIIKSGGGIIADFDTNNGEIIVEGGGECVCANTNNGTVYVEKDGIYQTSQGQVARNNGTVNVAPGGVMQSRFGSTVINESGGTINLDGTFMCGCVGFESDVMWFENHGAVNGQGSIVLYEADRDVAPVTDMDALIEEMMAQLGQETRFENWEDVNIYKLYEVRTFDELSAALPGDRVVAGEQVEGDMDVMIQFTENITVPEGGAVTAMAYVIIPEGISLTIEGGGLVSCGIHNSGSVEVLPGGVLCTTMGGSITNLSNITVHDGAEMLSQMGGEVINEQGATLTLDGEFYCGCIGFDGNEGFWFQNGGTVSGHGSVILYEADGEIAPVTDMDALIEGVMAQLGQETRFENWEDINIFKTVTVSSYEELAAALPGDRVVAGEHVEGDMDVIAVLVDDITVPEGGNVRAMATVIVPEGFSLTVADGGTLESAVENLGSVSVLPGGKLYTTMGGSISNYNEMIVAEGAELKSQMGGEVINEEGAELTVDGEFLCGCIGFEGNDGFWFENRGDVHGTGSIILYEADSEILPVSDMESLAESAQSIVGTGENKPEVRVKETVEEEINLPFELVAPANVYAERLEETPTSAIFVYSLSNDMTTFFKNKNEAALHNTVEQFMSEYDYDDVWMSIQIDWALDDVDDEVSGWHYNEYWDGKSEYGLGRDGDGHYRYSDWDIVDGSIGNAEETVNDVWVTRGVPNDERWYGNPEELIPGVKDQLNPGQYTYDENANDGDGELFIDFTEHTMYYRARFVLTARKEGSEDKYYFSDWSDVTCVGKDAVAAEPLTEEDLVAPVITSLHMTDKEFNGNPIVAFMLTVPDALAENAAKVAATGGQIVIEVEGRVQGDEDFVSLQGDWIIRGGEMESALFNLVSAERPNVPKDTVVELRCRYRYDHPRFFDGCMYSDYSKIISFGTDDITQHQGNPGDERVEAEITVTRPVHSRILGNSTASAGEGYGITFCTFLAESETPLGPDTVFAAGNYYDYEFTVTPLTQAAQEALGRTDVTVNDEKADSVTVNANDGTITVRKRFYCPKGDVNADGEVDNKDLTRLFQYLSNWDVEVNKAALDINGDNSVDNKDLTRLFQFLSNWDVEIF